MISRVGVHILLFSLVAWPLLLVLLDEIQAFAKVAHIVPRIRRTCNDDDTSFRPRSGMVFVLHADSRKNRQQQHDDYDSVVADDKDEHTPPRTTTTVTTRKMMVTTKSSEKKTQPSSLHPPYFNLRKESLLFDDNATTRQNNNVKKLWDLCQTYLPSIVHGGGGAGNRRHRPFRHMQKKKKKDIDPLSGLYNMFFVRIPALLAGLVYLYNEIVMKHATIMDVGQGEFVMPPFVVLTILYVLLWL